jgi:hypothetical protein|tara:strand:- start:1379 stop:1579 length:201 start_codon:yes stop_codon:yes gene_type:complete
MARPKKKIQKREKVFAFVSKTIDFIQAKWKPYTVGTIFLAGTGTFIYVVFFWLDKVESIELCITYF